MQASPLPYESFRAAAWRIQLFLFIQISRKSWQRLAKNLR